MLRALIATVLFVLPAWAERVSVAVDVHGEEGVPISNAVVTVSTQKMLLFGYGSRPDHFLWVSNVTDKAGTAVVNFDCCTADFSCSVSADGYYAEKITKGRFSATEDASLKMRFSSTTTNLSFTLRRKIRPIAMYTHGLMLNLKVPGEGDFVGYDLMENDWVDPYGKGKMADFEVSFCRSEENGCVRRTGKMRFPQQGSGAYIRKMFKSDGLRSAYTAKTNEVFQQNFESLISINRLNPAENVVQDVISDDEYMVLRTRPIMDSEGKVVSVHYSKIYGPIRIDREFRFEQSSFNPTENDPNLEYDIKQNLNRKSHRRTRP